jgi:hypothetical protein
MDLPEGINQISMIEAEEKRVHEWLQENPPPDKIKAIQKQNG